MTRQKELYVDPKASWQIEFLWQLSKLNPNGVTTDISADQNMFVLTIFKKIREMWIKFSQGSIPVLQKMTNYEEGRFRLTNI